MQDRLSIVPGQGDEPAAHQLSPLTTTNGHPITAFNGYLSHDAVLAEQRSAPLHAAAATDWDLAAMWLADDADDADGPDSSARAA